MREETKRVLALPRNCDERGELSRQDQALRSKERREEKERKQRDGYEGMSREEMMAWHNMNDMIFFFCEEIFIRTTSSSLGTAQPLSAQLRKSWHLWVYYEG